MQYVVTSSNPELDKSTLITVEGSFVAIRHLGTELQDWYVISLRERGNNITCYAKSTVEKLDTLFALQPDTRLSISGFSISPNCTPHMGIINSVTSITIV